MKKAITLLSLVPLLFGIGCSSVKMSPSLVQQGVAVGVSYGVQKYPQALPGVRIAGEVICSAANGTNISPANVVAAVQATDPNLSAETTLIINGALLLYTGIWNSYGATAVANQETLRGYLQATCSGIHDGLPMLNGAKRSINNVVKVRRKFASTDWPLVQAK